MLAVKSACSIFVYDEIDGLIEPPIRAVTVEETSPTPYPVGDFARLVIEDEKGTSALDDFQARRI